MSLLVYMVTAALHSHDCETCRMLCMSSYSVLHSACSLHITRPVLLGDGAMQAPLSYACLSPGLSRLAATHSHLLEV